MRTASVQGMSRVRIGRPTFLKDSALSAAFGAVGALPVAVVLALTDFPEWGETLLSFLVIGAFFYLVGLAIRALLHLAYAYMIHGTGPGPEEGPLSRTSLLGYSLPWLRFGAGSAGAAGVLVLGFLIGTGETGW